MAYLEPILDEKRCVQKLQVKQHEVINVFLDVFMFPSRIGLFSIFTLYKSFQGKSLKVQSDYKVFESNSNDRVFVEFSLASFCLSSFAIL